MQLIRNLLKSDKSVFRKGNHQPDTALLVLLGLGSFRANWEIIGDGFSTIGDMDVYVPDIIARKSITASAEKLHQFILTHGLADYQNLNIFTYIMGGRILNQYLAQHKLPNLSAIIYDRSPIQELASVILTARFPRLSWLFFGNILRELAESSYQPCPIDDVPIGLLIENKATPLMRRFKREALAIRPLDWRSEAFQHPHHDIVYVPINHDEMYWRFDLFMDDVRSFFQTRRFLKNSNRKPLEIAPFRK